MYIHMHINIIHISICKDDKDETSHVYIYIYKCILYIYIHTYIYTYMYIRMHIYIIHVYKDDKDETSHVCLCLQILPASVGWCEWETVAGRLSSMTVIEERHARSAKVWSRTQRTCIMSLMSTTLISTTVPDLTKRAASEEDVNSANPPKKLASS